MGKLPSPIGGRLAAGAGTARFFLFWPPVWLIVGVSLLGVFAAYQTPRLYIVDVGAPQDQLYVRNFHTRIEDEYPTYRWSSGYGYVHFPGLGGSRPFTATVQLDPGRQAPIQVDINGATFYTGTMEPGWQTLRFYVGAEQPAALQSRDTVLEIRAPDYRTSDAPTQPKGVKLSLVSIEQAAEGSFIVPPIMGLVWLGGGLLLLYGLAGVSLHQFASRKRARQLAGVLLAAVGGLLFAWVLQSPVDVAGAALHIFVTLFTALLILLVCSSLAQRRGANTTLAGLLGLAVALAFVVRYGGMGLPQSVIIDMPWHMKWLGQLLTGDWQSLYFPGGLSSVPKEWGAELLIPKSPLFYFAVASFDILPFEIEILVKWLICFLDASLVGVAFWLTMRLTSNFRAGLAAALLYALTPLAFRGLAYGILPTIFAQWLAAVTIILLLHWREQKWNSLHWIVLVLLSTLTLLSFPTVAIFFTLLLIGVFFGWRLMRGAGIWDWRIPALLAASWLLAVWVYYGLYISPVLASASALLNPQPGDGTVRLPGGFAELLAWTGEYVVSLLPAILALAGLLLLCFRGRGRRGEEIEVRRKGTLMLVALWLGVAPLFVLVNYRVDMIGKHLYFTMLPVAAVGGMALWAVWSRGRWGRLLAALALAAVGWQALTFWVARLVSASS